MVFLYDIYIYIYTGIYVYVYIYKEFCVGESRRKQCYIVHIAPRGVNNAILFVYRTGYVYGKEPEGFQKVFLSPFNAG